MPTFTSKAIYLAVLGALTTLGAAGPATAVHVSPRGLGQALIFPYYTVRTADAGAYNTYVSLVNTTNGTKAIKVRFREGRNGRAVLDFNVYLSPYDVWTGVVVPVDATNAALGAKMITADRSCTVPTYLGNEAAFTFKNTAYSAANADGETTSLDRTSEGYFEMIEMGDITTASITTGIKHVLSVPANCGVLGAGEANAAAVVQSGTGGLMGSAVLINVANGVDYGYDPVVLEDFRATAAGPVFGAAGSSLPDLSSSSPKISRMLNGTQGLVTTDWSATAGSTPSDAVSAVLMADNVINEFMLDAATASGTDWVVTFPTKHEYVGKDVVLAGVRQNSPATRPFQRNFSTGGSCDEIEHLFANREDAPYSGLSIPGVPPQNFPYPRLCWQANVITFTNGAGIASKNLGSVLGYSTPKGYQNGWMNLALPIGLTGYPNAHALVAPPGSTTVTGTSGATATSFTYVGLPVIGFAVQDFANGALVVGTTPTLSNYGHNFTHKLTTRIIAN